MNSIGSILCDDESTKISKIAIIGNSAIIVSPIFQPDKLLKYFMPKSLRNNSPKLHFEIPSIPVLIKGNSGASYCFKSGINKVGITIEIRPKIEAKR